MTTLKLQSKPSTAAMQAIEPHIRRELRHELDAIAEGLAGLLGAPIDPQDD